MLPPLSDDEQVKAANDAFDFVVSTRYQTLKVIRQTFFIVMAFSVVIALYQTTWWPLLFGLLFCFVASFIASRKWAKYAATNTGLDEAQIIAIWNTHLNLRKLNG